MARTDIIKVKEIIDTGLEDKQILAHITVANLMVDEHLLGEGYSANLLAEIERWLSAHFVAVQDPRISSQNIGDHNITYEGRSGNTGLSRTRYGQQVMILDYHGVLAAANKSKGQVKFKAT